MSSNAPHSVAHSVPETDRYRPSWHFTPQRNWMNDPNGLVYFEGEYHLFYQYNPFGNEWGHMSWGHAVSTDLIHWDELPVAIPETDREMIFSGCAIVDWDNVSGLGDGKVPPLLAYFTAHDSGTEMQTQHLAYSHDRGRSFIHYDGNPLIDPGLLHFRDPKIFRHAPSAAWIMVVALPREHKVQFYRSTDLLDWSLAGAFGPAGATSGQWECPDLILVPIDGCPGSSRWVLKVDVDAGFVGGGSGAQYFVGDFDGQSFKTDLSVSPEDGDIVDFGPDFYAAVTWSDLPPEQSGPVWVGWMSNHQTGRFYPTGSWRGAQSLPRTLFLFEEAGLFKLGQRPIDALAGRPRKSLRLPALTIEDQQGVAVDLPSHRFHAAITLTVARLGRIGLTLLTYHQRLLRIELDRRAGTVRIVRPADAQMESSIIFEAEAGFAIPEELAVDLWFDGCLLEIFLHGGRRVMSACLFPAGVMHLVMRSEEGTATITSIRLGAPER